MATGPGLGLNYSLLGRHRIQNDSGQMRLTIICTTGQNLLQDRSETGMGRSQDPDSHRWGPDPLPH